ncbi:MAG: di-trans,poly-cis-decaprenylcistransferase [Rhodospirillaceae bacterium]|nr:di-trans,poly-cis-decaprenylcistransferase [Rhodospirillaceae bacterium]|tara:strand:- start:190 stop:876 length:687 start_codon:yes stop_codon:yes gene_type:complete
MKLDHLAIIMDGNRRWANTNNLPSYEGHKKGAENLWNIINNIHEFKLKFLTVFVFSTENWKRSRREISFLMNLLNQFLDDTISKNTESNFRVRFIGDLTPFDKKIKDKIEIIQNNSQLHNGVVITLALNYGGRLDIISAINEILLQNNKFKPINENDFKKYTLNKDLPDPDLLIRTGGEMRLSNFLLWDLAYTELMFVPQMWPDFDKSILENCILDYSKRTRKYGGDN